MDFEGMWDIVIATPIGQQKVRLIIENTGGTLSGFAAQGSETVPFKNVEADGSRLRWSQDVTKPMALTVKFDVTVEGDTLTGTAKAGIFPASKVTGQRAAS